MTSQLTVLKKIAGFPFLTQEEVLHLKNECHRNLLRLKRMAHLVGATEERERKLEKELQAIRFYDQLAGELTKPCSVYTLLAEFNPCDLDDETAKELIIYWEEQFTLALEKELNPLSLVMFLEEEASSPILLAALIHCLLKRGISTRPLIQSGLFHRYYVRHVAQIDNIISTYSLLAQTNVLSNSFELTELLELLKQVSAPPIRGIELRTLSGHLVFKEPLYISLAPPKFAVTPTKENLTLLSHFFGHKFLIQILLRPLTQELNAWFFEALPERSIEQLEALYTYTLSSIAEDERPHVLYRLSRYISNAQAIQILESGQVSLWVILACKPRLLTEINEAKVASWILSTPVTLNDISYALDCMKHHLFKSFDEYIYLQVLDLLMDYPTVELTSSIQSSFKNNPNATKWCALYSRRIWSDLKQDILSNLPLTEDHYLNICDSYTRKSRQWYLLEQLSPSPLDYPRDIYSAQSYLIKTLFDKQIVDLDFFDVLHSKTKYQDYDHPEELRINAIERTLLACLTQQNDTQFQEWIIQLLQTECSKPDWQLATINGVSVRDKAIEHNNTAFLKRYYGEIEPEKRLAAVNQKNKEGNTVLHCASSNPETLKAILELLSEKEQRTAVVEKNRGGHTVLHCASQNPESLTTILSFFPKNERFALVKEKSRYCETLMDLALSNPPLLHAILSLLPEHQHLAALHETYDYCIKINQSWGEHRQVFKSYIHKLQADLKHLERITEDRFKIYPEPEDKTSLDYTLWNKLHLVEQAQLELTDSTRNIDENIDACIAMLKKPEHREILSKCKDTWLIAATKMTYSPEVLLIYKQLMGEPATQDLNNTPLFFKKHEDVNERNQAYLETQTEKRFES